MSQEDHSFIVTMLPSHHLSFTNCVYVNPFDFARLTQKLANPNQAMVKITNTQHQYFLRSSSDVQPGQIALSGLQRENIHDADASFLSAHPVNFSVVPSPQNEMNLFVECRNKHNVELKRSDFLKHFKDLYANHVFLPYQTLAMQLNGGTFIITLRHQMGTSAVLHSDTVLNVVFNATPYLKISD